MTNIELFYNENNKIKKVIVNGHANYSNNDDIVCASISCLTQTAILGLVKVVGLNINYKIKEAYLTFDVPQNLSYEDELKVDAILKTLREGLLDIQSGYKKFVKLEEKYNVY